MLKCDENEACGRKTENRLTRERRNSYSKGEKDREGGSVMNGSE